MDETRAAPLVPPLGSLLREDEDAGLTVLPNVFLSSSSPWWARGREAKTVDVQEVHLLCRFILLQRTVFSEKIKKMCVTL